MSRAIIFIQRVEPVGEQAHLYLVAVRHDSASNKRIPLITWRSRFKKKKDCVRGETVETREGIARRLYTMHRAQYSHM